jgi:hypothetical protein
VRRRDCPLTLTFRMGYIPSMACEVEYTDEFNEWWEGLDEAEQESVATSVILLEEKGTSLPFPHSSAVEGSKYGHMRELRVQHKGNPYRILYAFDPRRIAVLLIGGNKGGDDRWYEKLIPKADKIYEGHLKTLERERKDRI